MTSLALIPADVETDCDLHEGDPGRSLLPKPCQSCPHMSTLLGNLSTSPIQNASYWKYQARNNRERLMALQEKYEVLEAENRRLKQDLYGKKSEQAGGGSEGTAKEVSRRPRGHQKGVPSRGRRTHDTLPAEVEIIDLPEDNRCCPSCQKPFAPFGPPETSEILEIEVKAPRRIIHRNRYKKTCSCPDTKGIVSAPPAPRLISKGLLGISIWGEILFFKFALHLPLARLLASWRERGLSLSAGTITSGLRAIAALFAPLYDALVLQSRTASFSQADETRYYVFDPALDKARQWAWVILTPDTVLYILDPTRSARVPLAHFSGRPGVLLVDRYGAGKREARQVPDLRLAFCWSHVRRDFLKATVKRPELSAWSSAWTGRIATLFHETNRMREGDLSARTAVLDLLTDMKTTAREEQESRTLPQSARAVAKSLLAHWDGLILFVDDPRIPLDNNASERALRGLVIGRKVFYGAGASWSGTLVLTLSSLFGTWDRTGLNLRTALTDSLDVCARTGAAPSDLSPWLPWTMTPERRELLSRPLIRDPA